MEVEVFTKNTSRFPLWEKWKGRLACGCKGVSLLVLLFITFAQVVLAQSPINAHRWTSGDGWRFNTSTGKWDPTVLASPNLQPKGIIRCASSAEEEGQLQNYAHTYDPIVFLINPSLTNCFNQETGTRPTSPPLAVPGPTTAKDIVWFNFDIRPLAGTYQFQIITNDQVGWALYFVNPDFAGPPATNTATGTYPESATGLSGFTGNNATDLSHLVYADCGISGNGWSTIKVPSFLKPSNYYLAMWPMTQNTFTNNLIFKARFGCGGSTCFLEPVGSPSLSCMNGGYSVCQTFNGSEGRWKITDNAAVKATSYTVTTYNQFGAVVENYTANSDANLYLELGTTTGSGTQTDIKAVICATYGIGQPYDISLTPAGDPSDAPSNYVACTSGGSFSGSGLTLPNVSAGADKVLTCTTTQVVLSGSSTTAGVTYSWVATNGGHIVSGATTATPTVDAAGTYTLTVTNPANGCKASDAAEVTVNNTLPNVSAGADKVLTCTTTQVVLSGSSTTAGVTYSWVATNGGHIVSGATTATPTVDAAGTYTLTVTNPANGCKASDAAEVTVNNTLPNVSAGADKVLTCTTTQVVLSGSSTTAGVTYSWVATNGGHIVSGATTATPTVDAAGTYTLTVTNPANGCKASDAAEVTVNNTLPNVSAGADKVLTCTTTQVVLSGSSTTAGVTYSWVATNGGHIVSGATTATPTVDAAGTYTLTVTNPANGCKASDAAEVTVNNTLPNVSAGADKVLTCTTTQVVLSGSSTTAGVTYSWVATNGGHIVSGATTATPTVDAAGTYTLTVTNPANGCKASDAAEVTVNNTLPNVSAGADKVLTCTTTQVVLSGSSTTAGVTYSWVATNGGHIVSGATTATPTVDAAGTYTLTVTNPANGCKASDAAEVTVNNTLPNVSAGADKVLTCTTTQVVLSGSSTTAGVTYSWVATNGGHIVSGATTATPTVDAAGTYTLTVTNPANGCTASDAAVVTVNNTVPNVSAGADKVLTCTTTSLQLSGSSTTANATFSWVATNGGHIVSGATTATPTVDAAGTYTLTVTNPANGCTASDAAVVTVQPCTVVLCTYTQGAYGSAGGKMCNGKVGGLTTIAAITQAIDAWPNDKIVLGNASRSVTVALADAMYVINYLPGGGNSSALKHNGALSISTLPPASPNFQTLYTTLVGKSRYKINNTLMAQTLTLALNMGLNSALSNFALEGGKYLVTADVVSCGSTTMVPCSYHNTWIDASVINALGANKTVQGLYGLANRALGGENVGVSLTAIANVVDAINNAFDGCRLFVRYSATPVVCDLQVSNSRKGNEGISQVDATAKPTVSAFPNPFSDKLRFVITSPVSGKASLELFNVLGQKVGSVYQGHINAGASQQIEYKVPVEHQINLMYILRINNEQVSGTLLHLKN